MKPKKKKEKQAREAAEKAAAAAAAAQAEAAAAVTQTKETVVVSKEKRVTKQQQSETTILGGGAKNNEDGTRLTDFLIGKGYKFPNGERQMGTTSNGTANGDKHPQQFSTLVSYAKHMREEEEKKKKQVQGKHDKNNNNNKTTQGIQTTATATNGDSNNDNNNKDLQELNAGLENFFTTIKEVTRERELMEEPKSYEEIEKELGLKYYSLSTVMTGTGYEFLNEENFQQNKDESQQQQPKKKQPKPFLTKQQKLFKKKFKPTKKNTIAARTIQKIVRGGIQKMKFRLKKLQQYYDQIDLRTQYEVSAIQIRKKEQIDAIQEAYMMVLYEHEKELEKTQIEKDKQRIESWRNNNKKLRHENEQLLLEINQLRMTQDSLNIAYQNSQKTIQQLEVFSNKLEHDNKVLQQEEPQHADLVQEMEQHNFVMQKSFQAEYNIRRATQFGVIVMTNRVHETCTDKVLANEILQYALTNNKRIIEAATRKEEEIEFHHTLTKEHLLNPRNNNDTDDDDDYEDDDDDDGSSSDNE